ncbi:hypothetical protein ADT71_18200 [Novosphingobium sp. ST904]|nr:hypothetical protein ADT71_18200 [Novosphingobium sp. ST904]
MTAFLALPSDGVDMAVPDRFAQGFGHAHHHQQIAAGKARQAGVESAKNISFGIEMAGQWRAGKVHVIGNEHETVHRKTAHEHIPTVKEALPGMAVTGSTMAFS